MAVTAAQQQAAKSLCVSRKMSSPTIQVTDTAGCVMKGRGLALIATPLEQDAAYWEWHITLPARQHVDTILFGVTGRKDRTFYQELEGKQKDDDTDAEEEGQLWLCFVSCFVCIH
jgi:hypothetical protein